jgi:hypothetical protein
MSVKLLVAVVGAVLGAIALIALPAEGQAPSLIAKGSGSFHVDCTFSHRRPDDPIVFFRGPGASHMHDFFGSRGTKHNSTPKTIQKATTSCSRDEDRSAYWAPTLYVGRRAVRPNKASIYYRADKRDVGNVRAFPRNLRVIAGDAGGGEQMVNGRPIYSWACTKATITPATPAQAPVCADGGLGLTLFFPDCWNGAQRDSEDHKSHMAYSAPTGPGVRGCPPSHPHVMPMLRLHLHYPVTGGPDVRLSSGDLSTTHADFMNGWDQRELARLVAACVKVDKYCGGQDYPVPGHP